MSRWPRGIDLAYLQHESEQRIARIVEMTERRLRELRLRQPLPNPIIDRDPGDEDDGKATP